MTNQYRDTDTLLPCHHHYGRGALLAIQMERIPPRSCCGSLQIVSYHSQGALRSTAFEDHGKNEGIWERVAHVHDLAKDIDLVTFCYQSDYSSRSGRTEQQPSETVFFFKDKDIITDDEMFADTYKVKLVDDVIYEINGKLVTRSETSIKCAGDVVLNHRLQEFLHLATRNLSHYI
uniref:TCTP domain-containing protein n=1 Tax=Glossina morsitans morsitans TaxID=37546 RepID=A0A1B0G5D6_GLOMM